MGLAHRLVRAGDVEGLQELLMTSPAVANEVDEHGRSPLLIAVGLSSANLDVIRLLLEAGADPNFLKPKGESFELPELVLQVALKIGNLDAIKLLHAHGADFTYRDAHNYTAVINAIYGTGDRLPLVEYLIGLGLDVTLTTTYGESAIKSAYGFGQFRVVEALIRAGADETVLKWSPLHRAIALGSHAEVEEELRRSPDFKKLDVWGRNPLHLAAFKGDLPLVQLFHKRGADLNRKAGKGEATISFAVRSESLEVVEWLLKHGCDIEGRDYMGYSALSIAAVRGQHEMMRLLLSFGANPNPELRYGSILEEAHDRKSIMILLEHGADIGGIDYTACRKLVGFDEEGPDALYEVTKEQYLSARYPREGQSNPEDMTEPYKLAMIRSGSHACWARDHFNDPETVACGLKGEPFPPVWCFQRLGQSTTILPDGRIVLVAGEYEDWYDPDFCIYNDVTVFHPDGEIRVYGYPYAIFSRTDFHSATLIGDFIYLIGSLGYTQERTPECPVYRLNATNYQIERLETEGDKPGRIFSHRATIVDRETIRVEGGTSIQFKNSKEKHMPNEGVFELDIPTLTWRKVPR